MILLPLDLTEGLGETTHSNLSAYFILRYKTRNIAIVITPLNTHGLQTIAQNLAQVRRTAHNVSYETMALNFDRAYELS